jgi:hypothetical protein
MNLFEKGIFCEIIEKIEAIEITENINNLHVLLEKLNLNWRSIFNQTYLPQRAVITCNINMLSRNRFE